MTVQLIPVKPNVPHQSFKTQLEGVVYGFELQWNHRTGIWFMNLTTAAGARLIDGVALVLGTGLMANRRPQAFPPGQLIIVSDDAKEATLQSLGETARLIYLESADVAEAMEAV